MAAARLFILTLSVLLVASVAGQQRQVTLVVGQSPGGQLQVQEPAGVRPQQVNELQTTPGQQQQRQQQQQPQQPTAEVEEPEEEEDEDEVEEQVVNGLLEWLDKKKKQKKEKKRGEKKERKRRRKKERQPLIIPVQPAEPKQEKKEIHIHINIVKKEEHGHKKGHAGYHHYHEGHHEPGGHDKHYSGKHSWPLLSHHHNWEADFGAQQQGDQHDDYGGYASNQVANYTRALAGNATASAEPRPGEGS